MPTLGLIDAADVMGLSDDELTEICNCLIRFNLQLAGISPSEAVLTQAIDVRDGGIDASARWEDGPASAGFIPCRNTGFQCKATKMTPKECGKELLTKDGKSLKPKVRELLESGGTYVLLSGANDPTSQLIDKRLDAMRRVVSKHIHTGSYELQVWGAKKIADWICTFLPAIAYVSNRAGRTYPSELRSFDEWASMHDHQNAYAPLPSQQSLGHDINRTLSQNGQAFRLYGLPGLGKSRLALETLRKHNRISYCAYIDVAAQSVSDYLPGLVLNWKRHKVTGILVIDNCPAELHERICAVIDQSNLSILTIDYNLTRMRRGTPFFRLERLSSEDMRAIILAQYKGRFSEIALERIIARADGWPFIALRLAAGLLQHGDHVEDALEETLMARILGIEKTDRDSLRVIRTLALFEHVGFEAPYKDHLEHIRVELCESMKAMQFADIVQDFRQRGILVKIGSLLRVTPPPMAVQLASEWIQAYPQLRERLFAPKMPPELADYFCKQFVHLDTVQEAREIAGKSLAAGGLIGDFGVLKTRRGARVYLALSKIAPAAAVACLLRTIPPCDREELLAYRDGRREVLWALEHLMYPSDLFLDSARILFHLADAENESVGNNATGILTEKFAVLNAQTEAPGELRLRFLDELIRTNDERRLIIAAKCVGASFQGPYGITMLIDPPNMDRPISIWNPDPDESLIYRLELFARAKQLSELGGQAGEIVRHAVSSGIRTLLCLGLIWEMDDLVRCLNRHAAKPWKEAIQQLHDALKYEAKKDADMQEQINALLEAISPVDIIDRVRLIVTDPPVDFENCDGAFIDRSAKRAADFAADVVSDNRINEVISLIVRGTHRKGIEFGKALAIATNYADSTIAHILAETAKVPSDEQNIGPLAGALSALADHARGSYRNVLTNLLADIALRDKTVSIVAIVRPTNEDITQLIEALNAEKIETDHFEALAYGSALEGCSDEMVERLLEVLNEKAAYRIGYNIASMQLVKAPEKWTRFSQYIKNAILHIDVIGEPLTDIHDWSVISDVERLLDSPGNEDLAQSLALNIFSRAKKERDFELRKRLSDLALPLFRRYLNITWNLFLTVLSDADTQERYWLLQLLNYLPAGSAKRRSVLDDIPTNMLLDACRQYSDILPQFVARTSVLYLCTCQDELHPTPQALMILEHFAEDDKVRTAFFGNIMNFASTGARGPYYRERLRFLNGLPYYGNGKTHAWLKLLCEQIEETAIEQEKRDIEFLEGAW